MWAGVEGEVMDLDLNEEPSESGNANGLIAEIAPWLEDLERSHGEIEERLRQLEAIVSRIRERETSRPLERETPALVVDENPEATAGYIHERSRIESCTLSKTDPTYLIAKALGMEKTNAVAGRYFDCNICLERAEDPVLTCCGHLFCWSCFYQLPCSYFNAKECPVCDGEVTDSEVIPIYGNGDDCDGNMPKSKESGILVPPRPSAKRVESVRQNVINRAIPFLPTHETIQQMRRAIDAIEQQSLPRGYDIGMANPITNGNLGNQPLGPLRLFPPAMPPFSSFPAGVTVDYLQEPIDTFDSYVDSSNVRRNRRRSSRIADRNSSRSIGATEPNIRVLDTTSRVISLVPFPVTLPAEFVVTDASMEMRNPAARAGGMDPSPSVPSASSSRRRTETRDVDDGPRTRYRRRRLR
ncbi:PREDICTED: uncharacterized protein LOC104827576 [Tarenaya hassleriana]|uniref:uncharacterized protein LOC104827576 n=1 Tax=Tarenaya hassleriana TaxID=28532 RepID=UPI00053C7E5B|nr:PREDICTED: uncharacterized protein LOC104827576 [Tarenaya hassleriana]XP_010559067.1 PREDICTED: uncharacterized protein LOC104827576 [Tarenaya hassleriana]